MDTPARILVSLIVVYLTVVPGWASNTFELFFARQIEEGTPPELIPKQTLLACMFICIILLRCLFPRGQTLQRRQTRLLEILDDGGERCRAEYVQSEFPRKCCIADSHTQHCCGSWTCVNGRDDMELQAERGSKCDDRSHVASGFSSPGESTSSYHGLQS